MVSSTSKIILSSGSSSSSSSDFLKEIELLNQIEKEVKDKKEEFKARDYDSTSATHEHFNKKLDECWERAKKNPPSQRDYLQAHVGIISALIVTYARDINNSGYSSSIWGVIIPPDKALQILGGVKCTLRTLSEDKEEKSPQVAQLAKAKLNEIEAEEIIKEIRIMSQNKYQLPFPGEDFLTVGNIEAIKAFKELKDTIYHRHLGQLTELLFELKRIIALFPSKEREEKGACCLMLKAANLLISQNELHFLRLFLNEGVLLAAAKKLCPTIEDPFDDRYEPPLSAKATYEQLTTPSESTVLVDPSLKASSSTTVPSSEKKEAMDMLPKPEFGVSTLSFPHAFSGNPFC